MFTRKCSTLTVSVSIDWESKIHPRISPTRYKAKTREKVPISYGSFLKTFASLGAVPVAAPPLTPDDVPNAAAVEGGGASSAADEFAVPTLEEMGYPSIKPPQKVLFPGGESEALARLEREVLSKKEWVCQFEKPKTSPNALSPTTTVLSPYLKFGCKASFLFFLFFKKTTVIPGHLCILCFEKGSRGGQRVGIFWLLCR